MDFRIFQCLALIIASAFYATAAPFQLPSEMDKWEVQGDMFIKCEWDETVEPLEVIFPNGTEAMARIACVGKGIPQALTTLPTLDLWDFIIDHNEVRLATEEGVECEGIVELLNPTSETWAPLCLHPDMNFNDEAARKFCVDIGFDTGTKANSSEFRDGPCELTSKRKKRQDEYLEYAAVDCEDY